jgi:hypothetical protein
MIARPADEWLYKVILNGEDVSKRAFLAVAFCGLGYVKVYRHDHLFDFPYVGADGRVATETVWGRVSIKRRGHR